MIRTSSIGLAPVLEDALWKTFGNTGSFYEQFYNRFGTWLAQGEVAQGATSVTNASDNFTIHDGVVKLGLEVVRDQLAAARGVTPTGTALTVFGDGTSTGPSAGYVRVDLADIKATDPQLIDTNAKPFGVRDIDFALSTALVHLLPSVGDYQSIVHTLLGATPGEMISKNADPNLQWGTLVVQAGSTTLTDSSGATSISDADFSFDGTSGTTAVVAIDGNGNNTITGTSGRDYMLGGNGTNTFIGGLGQDLILGGGASTYIAQVATGVTDGATFVGSLGAGSDVAVYNTGLSSTNFTISADMTDRALIAAGSTATTGADVTIGGRVDKLIDVQTIDFQGNKQTISVKGNPSENWFGSKNTDLVVDLGSAGGSSNTLDLSQYSGSIYLSPE